MNLSDSRVGCVSNQWSKALKPIANTLATRSPPISNQSKVRLGRKNTLGSGASLEATP